LYNWEYHDKNNYFCYKLREEYDKYQEYFIEKYVNYKKQLVVISDFLKNVGIKSIDFQYFKTIKNSLNLLKNLNIIQYYLKNVWKEDNLFMFLQYKTNKLDELMNILYSSRKDLNKNYNLALSIDNMVFNIEKDIEDIFINITYYESIYFDCY